MAILSEKHMLQVTAGAAAAIAGIAVRNLVEKSWTTFRDDETAPENPAASGVSWGDAIAFAALSGVMVAVARVVAKRSATAGFQRWVGHRPAGIEET